MTYACINQVSTYSFEVTMVLSIFLRLMVGHLVGDFVLQPLWLALAKRDGWPGLILHTAVVALTTAVMIWSVLPQWLLWAGVLYIVHLFIDQFKTFVFTNNSKGKNVIFFLLDQLVHVISLVLITVWATGTGIGGVVSIFTETLTREDALLVLISLVVIAGWVIPILEIEALVAINSFKTTAKARLEPIGISDRLMGGGERSVSIALALLNLGFVLPLAFLPRLLWLKNKQHPTNTTAVITKAGTSFVSGLLLTVVIFATHLAQKLF